MKNLRIIICRHAESLEDINNSVYDFLNDLDVPLTRNGIMQAKTLGKELGEMLLESTGAIFFTSPGLRNIQTMDYIRPSLNPNLSFSVEIEPLLVKQDWGIINSMNRQAIEEDRYKTGVLRYKFPSGESAEQMINRISIFRRKIIEIHQYRPTDIIVLSHGFEFRVLLMSMLGWTEDYFETLANVDNCEYRILTKVNEEKYILDRPLREHGLPVTRLSSSLVK